MFSQSKNKIINNLKNKFVFLGLIFLPISSVSIYNSNIKPMNAEFKEPIFFNKAIFNLDEPVFLTFSKGSIIDKKKYESEIKIFPNEDVIFNWNEDKTSLKISPNNTWKPETNYTVSFLKNNNGLSYLYSFETLSYPKVLNINPDITKNDFVFSKENNISVKFDKNLSDFDIQLVSRPNIKLESIYDSKSNSLTINPESDVENFDSYSVTIFTKHKKEDNSRYFPIKVVTFNAFLPEPDKWPEDFDDRLLIAKKSTIPKIKKGKYIDVNLEAQITTLFEGGVFVENFINSAGAKDTPTPKGEFQIYNKHPYALSNLFQVYMPYWMAFTPDGEYGFHDFPVWPEGHPDKPKGGKESEINIGKSVSPGCVRHSEKNSEKIYNWAEVGTKVVIY